uniref:UDENN domain-containing protein n=1 Tax=Phaeomonas parva TaxID=124430 RepID=A0A7S1TYQ9_9STRA|mmetsp:Transcript_23221/g.72509  ORF Transcript_23221/g.72509 Transcript_23221/m.72509 type:complete len:1604 (+) Transcript_23221:454-5265(+)
MSLSANQRPHKRLHEYFAIVGLPPVLSFAPDQSMASRLRPLEARYMMALLDRFPRRDHEDTPFPTGVPLFCMPCGLRLETKMRMPTFSTFVHTDGAGQHLYGHCLTIYEPLTPEHRVQLQALLTKAHKARRQARSHSPPALAAGEAAGQDDEGEGAANQEGNPMASPPDELKELQTEAEAEPVAAAGEEERAEPETAASEEEEGEEEEPPSLDGVEVLAPKCLVVLSYWPHHLSYREWLKQLYRVSLSPTPVPLEAYIGSFCHEVPLPPPGRTLVQVAIADQTISFHTPPENAPMSWSALPYAPLFECLRPADIICLFTCLLLEKHVVLISSQQFLLSTASEAVTSLLFPLRWSHVYIPILPAPLFGVLHAPMPFLIGMHTDAIEYGLEQQRIADGGDLPECGAQCAGDEADLINAVRQSTTGNIMRREDSKASHASDGKLDVDAASAQLMPQSVVRVFLDEGRIDLGTTKLPALPDKRLKKLLRTLETHADLHRRRNAAWRELVLPFYDAAFHHTYRPCDAEQIMRELEQTVPFWRRPFRNRKESEAKKAANDAFLDGEKNTEYTPNWNEVREAFLRFFVAMLRDYRQFMTLPTQDVPMPPLRFRKHEFLREQKNDRQALLKALVDTQNFHNFVDERCWPDVESALDIDLFDEAIDAKKNRSNFRLRNRHTPFLQSGRYKEVGTYFVCSPEMAPAGAGAGGPEPAQTAPENPSLSPSASQLNLTDAADLQMSQGDDGRPMYIYSRFPCLNAQRMPTAKAVPNLWKEENDPKNSRSLRLRNNPTWRGNSKAGRAARSIDAQDTATGVTFDEAVLSTFVVAFSSSIGQDRDAAGGIGLGLGLIQESNGEAREDLEIESPRRAPQGADTVDLLLRAATQTMEYPSPSSVRDRKSLGSMSEFSDCLEDDGAGDDADDGFDAEPCGAAAGSDDHEDSDAAEERQVKMNMMLEVAFEVIEAVLDLGASLDSHAFQSLIHACGRCGNVERAIKVLDFLEQANIQVTQTLRTALLIAFDRSGNAASGSGNLPLQIVDHYRRLYERRAPQQSFWNRGKDRDASDSPVKTDKEKVGKEKADNPLPGAKLHLIGASIQPFVPEIAGSSPGAAKPKDAAAGSNGVPASADTASTDAVDSHGSHAHVREGSFASGGCSPLVNSETSQEPQELDDVMVDVVDEAVVIDEDDEEEGSPSETSGEGETPARLTPRVLHTLTRTSTSATNTPVKDGSGGGGHGLRPSLSESDLLEVALRARVRLSLGVTGAGGPGGTAHSSPRDPRAQRHTRSPSFWDRITLRPFPSPSPSAAATAGSDELSPAPHHGRERSGMSIMLGLGGNNNDNDSDDSSMGSPEKEKTSSLATNFSFLRVGGTRRSSNASADSSVASWEPGSATGERNRKPRRRSRSALGFGSNAPFWQTWTMGDRVEQQLLLGQELLKILYPDLEIDTSIQNCPQCGRQLTEDDIFDGFSTDPNHYTIRCPHCDNTAASRGATPTRGNSSSGGGGGGGGDGDGEDARRPFVARFKVTSSAKGFIGSTGEGTPLYCEWLSPWTLQKETLKVISEDGIAELVSPSFRRNGGATATIWWNLFVYLQRYGLPVTFLLSASFESNRLGR